MKQNIFLAAVFFFLLPFGRQKYSVLLSALVWLMGLGSLSAQNIGINTTGNTPNTSAMLDVDATDKGVLVPRVALTSTSSASPVTSPATSLLVYNTATVNDVIPGFYYWDGSSWIRVIDNSSSNANYGKQKFTASGTFTTPAGVTTVWVTMCGGGGGGSGGGGSNGGGGGGGAVEISTKLTVTPLTSYSITVGAGGSGGSGGAAGGNGGNSSFGSLLTSNGGAGGTTPNGGAGGGFGSTAGTYGDPASGSKGGSSIFGTPGAWSGGAGGGYGGGGAGGCDASCTGGNGAPGFVLVEW